MPILLPEHEESGGTPGTYMRHRHAALMYPLALCQWHPPPIATFRCVASTPYALRSKAGSVLPLFLSLLILLTCYPLELDVIHTPILIMRYLRGVCSDNCRNLHKCCKFMHVWRIKCILIHREALHHCRGIRSSQRR